MVWLPGFLRRKKWFDRRSGKDRRQEQVGTNPEVDPVSKEKRFFARQKDYWGKMKHLRPTIFGENLTGKQLEDPNTYLRLKNRRKAGRRKKP